jgi:hypothetical protein
MTWYEWVQGLAAEQGFEPLSRDVIDELLWEQTAWPMGGTDIVGKQLREVFVRMNEKGTPVPKSADLEIHDPVDELPPVIRSQRTSRWDTVIDAAIEADGKWVPVTKPSGYTKHVLTDRSDGIVVVPRGDKIFVKYDPAEAQRLRDEATKKADAKADD